VKVRILPGQQGITRGVTMAGKKIPVHRDAPKDKSKPKKGDKK
jgi:hypothetical protein